LYKDKPEVLGIKPIVREKLENYIQSLLLFANLNVICQFSPDDGFDARKLGLVFIQLPYFMISSPSKHLLDYYLLDYKQALRMMMKKDDFMRLLERRFTPPSRQSRP